MKTRLLVVLTAAALVTAASCSGPAPDTGELATRTLPIVGGQPDDSYPAVGALTMGQTTFCTGTAIGTRVILTAAHCVDAARRYGGSGQVIQFRVDLVSGGKTTTKYIKITSYQSHPKYSGSASSGYDIGVMILSAPAPVIPIRHNTKVMDKTWIGKEPLFLGYGVIQTSPSRVSAKRKYGTKIPIIKVDSDRFTYQATDRSVCSGDSGGPALYQVDGAIKVLGVVSYGSGTTSGGQPMCDGSATSFRTDVYDGFIRPFLVRYPDGDIKCKADSECGPCAECKSGKCGMKTINPEKFHCQPCKDAKDCLGGLCLKLDDGYRCVQKCNAESCCPAGSVCSASGATKGSCVPDKQVCPDVACKDSSECGLAGKCEKGKCVPDRPPRAPALCHPCTGVADCDPGAICVGPAGSGVCLQPCGKGKFCPEGLGCVEVYPGLYQCQPEAGACTATCSQDAHCPKGFECSTGGTCGRKGGGTYGDPCDKDHPCKSGFDCTKAAMGNICVETCGRPAGRAGSLCRPGNKCDAGLQCVSLGGTSICMARCPSGQCSGGGGCYQGVCFCRRDSECGSGKVCNNDVMGYYGACTPANDPGIKTCDPGFECASSVTGGKACRRKAAGSQGPGQRCDSFVKCRAGLVCIVTSGGGRCIEDCSTTRTCKLGGSCLRAGYQTYLCLCRELECGLGRYCEDGFGQGYGFCRTNTGQGCAMDADCPLNHKCIARNCTYVAPEPGPPEAAPEPLREEAPAPRELAPDRTDAGVAQDTPPVDGKPNDGKGSDTADAGGPIKDQGAITPPAPEGCGCSATDPGQDAGIGGALLGAMLLLAAFRRTRRST